MENAPPPLVLLVTDDAKLGARVSEALTSAEVQRTADPRALPDAIAGAVVELVVVDARGTGGDGVVRAVRALSELAGASVLALGPAGVADRARLFAAGADDCVVVPFPVVELALRASRLMSDRGVREALASVLGRADVPPDRMAAEVASRLGAATVAAESLRSARDRAERVLDEKTRFLSLVSHELRTPLGALRLQLDRLKRDRQGRLAEEDRAVVERCLRSARRLDDLAESLLEYARVKSGRALVRSESFDLCGLVLDVVDELAPRAKDKGLELDVRLVPGAARVTSDPKLLRVCLLNLLANAVKFTDAGRVLVEVDQIDAGHRVSITDSGPGIAPEAQEGIFDAFERGAPENADRASGFGLGLNFVRELATTLGGHTTVRSEVGVGSTFGVWIPG